jgi:RimJ/RimL family protein N-acetyltransferase
VGDVLDPVTLSGYRVRLEPLSMVHAADLVEAADEDRLSYGFTVVPTAQTIDDYILDQLERQAAGQMLPFAQVRLADGKAVGCTAYWDPRTWPGGSRICAIEIGWTWLGASAQRSGINREAKYLLFQHAFEGHSVSRVDLKTDARNLRSRQAIERLGARFEGVLRNWSPSRAPGEEGLLRDSAIFSVIETEWPSVKARLARQLTD